MELSDLLIPFLFRLPLFIVWLVGIVFAILHLRRYPRVSISAIIAFLVLGFSTLLSLLLPYVQFQAFRNADLLNVYFALQRVVPFLDIIGWILVVIAIFSGRRAVEQKTEPVS